MKYKLIGKANFDLVQQVCETRGVDYKNIQEFLNPNDWVITNPEIYKNLKEVANIIIDAVKNELKIAILIDSDVDGYCSSAMIVNYLREVMNFTGLRMYLHNEKTHGLTPYIMSQIKDNIPNLLIIPDASSADYVQHEELYEMGVETIIIDHHEAEKYSTFAKVVNNQLDPNGNKTLSAGGMVIKLLEMLDKMLGVNKAQDYYDLASISLVGDCMMMNVPETRYYVLQGLLNIRNPFIEELLKAEADRSFETISYDIAPAINAYIRMGSLEERQDLFSALVGIEGEREITIRSQGKFILQLHEYVAKISGRMKTRQTAAVKKALESKETKIISEDLPFTICLLEPNTLASLTGLIGNRLTDQYGKPAIVLLKSGNEIFKGSGRTIDTFQDFKNYCIESGYFKSCAGHAGAFGVVIEEKSLHKMIDDLKGSTLGEDSDCYRVDKAYIDNVSAYDIVSIDELNNYWSRGFDKPLFYVKLTKLSGDEIDVIGQKKNTIRIKKNNITYIKFKCEPEEIAKIKGMKVSEIELVGYFSVNEWNGNIYPQVLIEDLEFKGSEVSKESAFGFDFSNFNNIKW